MLLYEMVFFLGRCLVVLAAILLATPQAWADDGAALEQLVERTPKLSSDNETLHAFSVRVTLQGLVADIRWRRGEVVSAYVEDETSRSPVALHAEDKLLANDPANKTVWIGRFPGLAFKFSASDTGGYHLKLGGSKKDAEESEPGAEEQVSIDLPSFVRRKVAIAEADGDVGTVTFSFEIDRPDDTLTATFDADLNQPLVRIESASEEPLGSFRIDQIRLNDHALPPFVMPSREAVKAVSSVNADMEVDKEGRSIPEQAISYLLAKSGGLLTVLPVRIGLGNPALRPELGAPDDLDWEEVAAYDKEVSPRLREVIFDSQG